MKKLTSKRRFLSMVASCTMIIVTSLITAACTVIDSNSDHAVYSNEPWVVLPFNNNSGTPLAADRVVAIVSTLIRSNGVNDLESYMPEAVDIESLLAENGQGRVNDALAKAREHNKKYALTGSVEEWRYRSGVGGEPVVGISMQLLEVNSGKTIWTATGAKSGWGASSLSGTAQKLIRSMLAELEFTEQRSSSPGSGHGI
jgi:TolB-like protein